MPGLNDDSDDELESVTAAPDYNSDAAIAPPTILVNKVTAPDPADNDINAVKTSELFGGPVVPNELPNLNSVFVITTDITNKATDLISLRDSINSNCAVCKEDAEVTNMLIPGFINEEKPLGFFTDKRTKTQFSQTLASIDTAIDAQAIALKEASLKNIEELVHTFRQLKESTSTNLNSAVLKYQLGLAGIVGMSLDTDNAALSSFFSYLNEITPNDRSSKGIILNDTGSDECANPLRKGFAKYALKPDFSNNTGNVVTSDRTIACANIFGIRGEFYEITDKEPYLIPVSTIHDGKVPNGFTRGFTYLDFLHNGIDMVSLNYMQTLTNLSLNFTEAMVRGASLIEEISKKPSLTPKERLDTMTRTVAVVNSYATSNAAIYSFMNDYFNAYDWLMTTALDYYQAQKKQS